MSIISHYGQNDNVSAAVDLVLVSTRQRWRALKMADRIRDLGRDYISRAERMHSCGEWLKIGWGSDVAPGVIDARYCRDRLCPNCAWRRSRRQYGMMVDALARCKADHPGLHGYMLTLTVRNCAPADLSATISRLMNAWAKLQKRRPFQRAVCGWARNLEITYNDETDTFHPHFHILLLQDDLSTPLPWAASTAQYVTHTAHLRAWWLDALDAWDEYENGVIQVDCRAAYQTDMPDEPAPEISGAVLEATKYVIKSKAAEGMPRRSLRALADAIRGRRLTAAGGALAAYMADDIDDPSISEDAPDDDKTIDHTVILQWSYAGSAYYVLQASEGDRASEKVADLLREFGESA